VFDARVNEAVLNTAWVLLIQEMKDAIDGIILPVLVLEAFYTRQGLKARLSEALIGYLGKVSSVVLARAAAEVLESAAASEADPVEEEVGMLADEFPDLRVNEIPASHPTPRLQTGLPHKLYSHALSSQNKMCKVVS
jgi:hypothetical protein